MAPLGVQQHQRLIRRQSAQRCGADGVRAVCETGAREVERRQRCSERLIDLGDADIRQRFARDHIHGHGGIERGAIRDARAGDDDL